MYCSFRDLLLYIIWPDQVFLCEVAWDLLSGLWAVTSVVSDQIESTASSVSNMSRSMELCKLPVVKPGSDVTDAVKDLKLQNTECLVALSYLQDIKAVSHIDNHYFFLPQIQATTTTTSPKLQPVSGLLKKKRFPTLRTELI